LVLDRLGELVDAGLYEDVFPEELPEAVDPGAAGA
jgi:hypothetical protein